MKKILVITCFLFAVFSGKIIAQQETMGRKTAEQRADIITKNLAMKLTLTSSQIEQVREVVLKREKLRDAGKLSKEHQKDIHVELNKLLTKEQQKKWQESRKAVKKTRHEKGKQESPTENNDDVY